MVAAEKPILENSASNLKLRQAPRLIQVVRVIVTVVDLGERKRFVLNMGLSILENCFIQLLVSFGALRLCFRSGMHSAGWQVTGTSLK
jgi:hypothetical protein